MKVLFFTDIHGSEFAMKEIERIITLEKPNKVVFLGDILYHGPRNPFPTEYNPMGVANRIKNLSVPHVIIKGNCDSEVDEMVLEETFKYKYTVCINGKKVICTHGHKLDTINTNGAFAVIYGHYHINEHTVVNGVNLVNISSVSLPKNDCATAFATFDENTLAVKDFNQNTVFEIK